MRKLVITFMSMAILVVFSTAAFSDCPQDKDRCCTSPGECTKAENTAKGTASKEPKQEMAIDPVCRMDVAVKDAKYSYKYKDKTYYFCSKSCKESFAKDPSKYLDKEKKNPK